MIKIKRKLFEQLVDCLSEQMLDEWRSADNKPSVVNEPSIDMQGPSIVDPSAEVQMSDKMVDLPIEDKNWMPHGNDELGLAMKQMAELIPENQIKWFFPRLKKLIDDTLNNVDDTRMQPRLDDQ